VFLGHTLYDDHIGPQTESVGCILQTESRLGMVNFYRRYMPNCAESLRQYRIWPRIVHQML